MSLAALAGIGSGAVHAVAGPDHLLSLAPLSVGRARAWRVGLAWGLGHALGTLAAAAILFAAVDVLDLHGAERWGERLAGLALVGMGGWGIHRARRQVQGGAIGTAGLLGVTAVGLVHGLTGAAALLLLLPAAMAGSTAIRIAYLVGFSVGSTLAMAALTGAIAALTRRGKAAAALQRQVPLWGSGASVLLGFVWVGSTI